MESPPKRDRHILGMKVIVVDNSLEITGAFRAIFNNIQLADSITEWFYFVPEKSKNKAVLEKAGIKVFTFRSYELSRNPKNLVLFLPYLLWNGYKLSRIVSRHRIDVIYQNEVFSLSGLVAKWFKKVKVITHIRVLPKVFPRKLYRAWLKFQDLYADKIACVSFVCEREALSVYQPRRPINVFYDFPVPEERHPSIEIRDSSDHADILFLGNYTRGKGQDVALEAFRLIKERYPNWNATLHFYGSDFGYAPNIAFRNSLAQFIRKNLPDVAFLNNFAVDVESVMKQHDVVLNLSVAESFSFVVAEALSYGLPVIATNSGGPGELIEDNVSGYLVAESPAVIAEKIYDLCKDRNRRNLFSVNGKERINSLVAAHGGKQRFEEIFQF
jgi:L-malate glycosyltransferase